MGRHFGPTNPSVSSQLLINAVIGEVKFGQIDMSGNAGGIMLLAGGGRGLWAQSGAKEVAKSKGGMVCGRKM